jgi:predicted transcriptional regulator
MHSEIDSKITDFEREVMRVVWVQSNVISNDIVEV